MQQPPPSWGEDTNPISVILVSSGSRGNKLLFRFPFQLQQEQQGAQSSKPSSPYALHSTVENVEDHDGDSREASPLTDEELVAG
ncbi:GATOR complex protein NPRL3 [Scyliorhinus canicula]|uniref:GATOR complex protein NPRL3 n=1 Tax=Scyliorhinus canicula TaxID=7830 RepID=UPI0018F7D01B|nr:GATOR complex protein NPRL3 [Scyliorhinus canicula]